MCFPNIRHRLFQYGFISPQNDYVKLLFDLPFAETAEKACASIGTMTVSPRMFLIASSSRAVSFYAGKIPAAPRDAVWVDGSQGDGWALLDMSLQTVLDPKKVLYAGNEIFSDDLVQYPRLVRRNQARP